MRSGLFDEKFRLERISELGDTLEKINQVVDWSVFTPVLNAAIPRPKYEKGGRPPYDNLLMFKIILIKRLFNLSFDQTEYQITVRLDFMRFLEMSLGDRVPDAKTIWVYEETLAKQGTGKDLFALFFEEIKRAGYITREGSIVDASFIEAPKRKNSKEQREVLKDGDIPEEWDDTEHPQKLAQRDTDATWTKKGNESHFGYKDTVKVDLDSKIILDYNITPANTNDVKAAKGIFDQDDKVAYGDAAYPSLELPESVEDRFSKKATRNNPLTEEQKQNNHKKAKLRCRVEHVFAGIVKMVGGTDIKSKNLQRASFNISMLNLLYNMRRVVSLQMPTDNWNKRLLRLQRTSIG